MNKFENPAKYLGEQLKIHGLTITTAESCTAGGVANSIASIAGSSDYLVGGVVTYATEAKYKLLNVSPNTVNEHNVVSANVALEMATGAMNLFKTDVAIGITGIAGPSDDGEERPAGTIYICVAIKTKKTLAFPDVIRVLNCNFNSHNRADNINNAIYNAVLIAGDEVSKAFPTIR